MIAGIMTSAIANESEFLQAWTGHEGEFLYPYCEGVLQHIWALEGEREARGQEAAEAAQRHAQALEQVKLRDMAAADLQKKVPPR